MEFTLAAEGGEDQLGPPVPEGSETEGEDITGEASAGAGEEATSDSEGSNAVDEGWAADTVHDGVNAPSVGQSQGLLDDVRLPVVDGCIGSELESSLTLGVGAGCGEDSGP